MKAVPILIVTNALALGLGLMAYLELDDLKAQRVGGRQTASREGADDSNDYYDAQITELKKQLAAISVARGVPLPADVGAPADGEAAPLGKAIDRSAPVPEKFDETVELARPDFEYFRERVRLAQEENDKEERINREIDRLETLISNNRIGTLTDSQKKKAAETLIDTREKTRLIWRGLREREDLQNLPRDDQREAFRNAYRKEQENIQAAAQKSLEQFMPAADAETLMTSSRGGDFGSVRPTRGGRAGAGR